MFQPVQNTVEFVVILIYHMLQFILIDIDDVLYNLLYYAELLVASVAVFLLMRMLLAIT